MKPLYLLLIILFWIGLFFGSLYFPKWEFLSLDDKTLSIFTWGDVLEPSVIEEFEKETGIKVHFNFYYSNEELAVKLQATKGEGYDLIVPSDYAVKILAREGLLKEIDKSQLTFWNQLNPALLNQFFDPGNRYSIPFEWEIYGLGINVQALPHVDPSWKLVFDPPSEYKITMINDPIEAVAFSSFYLFGPKESLTPLEVENIKTLLTKQKKWVEAYTQNRGDYFLATKNCPLVLTTNQNAARTMRQFSFVDFIVPKEGTFISIENFCIPKASDKEKLVYKLINFLYTKESMKKHYIKYHFYPALNVPLKEFEDNPRFDSMVRASEIAPEKIHFLHKLLPQRELQELWIEVKN